MVTDTSVYFGYVNDYRNGHLWPFVSYLATSARRAAPEARVSAERLAAMPEEWRAAARPRKSSTASKLIDTLLDHPVFDAGIAGQITGSATSSVLDAISKLVEAGILHQVSEGKYNRVWVATDVMGEIESLNDRLRSS